MKNIHDPNWKYLAHFGYSKKQSLTYLKKENNLLVLGSQGKCNNSVRVCKILKKKKSKLETRNFSTISFLVHHLKEYNFEFKRILERIYNFGFLRIAKI